MKHIYCYRIKEFRIKLFIETSLYYDARSEKHQIMSLYYYISKDNKNPGVPTARHYSLVFGKA